MEKYKKIDTDINTAKLVFENQSDYKKLLEQISQSYQSNEKIPLWFAIANTSKINSAKLYNQSGSLVYKSNDSKAINYVLKDIYVDSISYQKISANDKLSKANVMEIYFSNNIKYTVQFNVNELLVYSSDLDYSIKYKFSKDGNSTLNDVLKNGFDEYSNIAYTQSINQNLNPIKPNTITG